MANAICCKCKKLVSYTKHRGEKLSDNRCPHCKGKLIAFTAKKWEEITGKTGTDLSDYAIGTPEWYQLQSKIHYI